LSCTVLAEKRQETSTQEEGHEKHVRRVNHIFLVLEHPGTASDIRLKKGPIERREKKKRMVLKYDGKGR
jgi:hypothetical protein